MLERILNTALEGEMDTHLSVDERSRGNRRNGKMPKQVQTRYGEVTIETPRDRDGSFEPQTVKKCETILAESMADQIIKCMPLVQTHVISTSILNVSLIPGYPQKPTVLSRTGYCRKSRPGVP